MSGQKIEDVSLGVRVREGENEHWDGGNRESESYLIAGLGLISVNMSIDIMKIIIIVSISTIVSS